MRAFLKPAPLKLIWQPYLPAPPGARPHTVQFLKGVCRLRPVIKLSVHLMGFGFGARGSLWYLIWTCWICSYGVSFSQVLQSEWTTFILCLCILVPSSPQMVLRLYCIPMRQICLKWWIVRHLNFCVSLLLLLIQRSTGDYTCALCNARTFRIYIDRTQGACLSDRLFICSANPSQGQSPV